MNKPARVAPGAAIFSLSLALTCALPLMVMVTGVGCAQTEDSQGNGSGGSTGAGSGSGGATGTGSGGLTGVSSGGSTGTGSGGSATTGSGGSSASSGGSTGSNSGGATGSSGGSTGTGSGGSGLPGSGGSSAGSGGRASTGGSSGTASGGRTGLGGASAATGGSSSGGASATGGASASTGGSTGAGGAVTANPMMNFFVSSDTSTTANLGGLAGADMRCQRLATAVGAGSKTWRAYLSAAAPLTNAIDRIGAGPYYNSAGVMVAADKAALHARGGDAALFITERGGRINGQWANSPTPIEHDILTGTLRDGTIATGNTCGDWTSTTGNSNVGHADGLGPNMGTTGMLTWWNFAHTGQCGNTAPGGGAGRIYCFVGP